MTSPKGKAKEDTLQAEDYLWPLTTLRDALLRPETERPTTRATIRSLLRHHAPRLAKPWEPFKSASAESRKKLSGNSVELAPGASFDVDAGSRAIATRLSDATGLDELMALLLWKSYARHSIEDPVPVPGQTTEDAVFDRLLLWYEQELLAVAQIVMALYVPSSESTGWEDLAAELRDDILGEQATLIEGLFRAFSRLAQKPVDANKDRALFWATFQLRQQETLLDLLFLILYQFTTRPASVSEGLVRGALLSSFGSAQANREIWEHDPECQRLQLRIRDLMLVIAIEALCLAQIVSPESDDAGDMFGATLLHSRDRIHALHQFIMEQTEGLDGEQETDEVVFPAQPTPIIALAWAIVLRSLPANLQPPSSDDFQLDTTQMETDEPLVYLTVANRALRLSSGLFPWLEVVLQGPLFEAAKDAFSGDLAVDMAALRRSPVKDLLIGLSELIHVDNIFDRPGLYRAWELLFGGGTRESSTSLSNNYWANDFVYDERRAILDQSHFPLFGCDLPRVLAALSGESADVDLDVTFAAADCVGDVFEYLTALPFVTVVVPPGTFTITGREANEVVVEASVDFELPGGAFIPRRTRGTLIGEGQLVQWRFRQQAWTLLVDMLRGAAGLPLGKMGTRLTDLGIQQVDELLASGLKLLRCVLRSPDVASRLITECTMPTDRFAGQSLLELALAVVADRTSSADAGQYAIDILQSLLLTGNSDIWASFRASGFFDSHSRRPGSVAALIQNDAMRGQHGLTLAVLRLVRSLASDAATTSAGDPHVVRAAIKLILHEVWGQFSGWRYRDVSERYAIAALLIGIFDTVLRHPLGDNAKTPSAAAAHLIQAFVAHASPLTYKPLVDVLTQAEQLATKLLQSRRWADAEAVFGTFDHAASLLASLIRIAPSLNVSATALPYSVFASTVVLASGERIQLVDSLFDLISQPTLQASSLRLIVRLLKVYLETSAHDPKRPSLAGMLRNAEQSCDKLANVAFTSGIADVKPDAWALLATIILTQPGCAKFCIGSTSTDEIGPLRMAIDEVRDWKTLIADGPRALAAVVGYCQAVVACPGATRRVAFLGKDPDFWQAIHDIATKHVPLPSSFSQTIASDVQNYSYTVQAKANATALMAAELALVIEEDGPETKAQSLVLSLFRNAGALQDAAAAATHTSCDPELHEREDAAIKANNISLARLRTTCLPDERDYGVQYLYDGVPTIFNDPERQSAIMRSLAILNLNWSQLDADIALTKAWRLLAEVAGTWTEGDALAAKACLRAATAIATTLAAEDRGGDVMLAIQTERLSILATLLETALPENDAGEPKLVAELAAAVRAIVESRLFNPILSLRHPELPPIHRPVLRLLLLLSQTSANAEASDLVREVLFDAGAPFALEAADIVLDTVLRHGTFDAEQDLGLVVALLCEMSRATASVHLWLDRLTHVNIIPRSLEVIVRTRPVTGPNGIPALPAHFHSVLLLHLALASCGPTAEKLAMSGVLPAYADNVVAVAAEQASIEPANDSLHRAWCGMMLVVKALLASLPNVGSFARSDVIPWVRVVAPQLLAAMAWDGETPLSRPRVDELELVCDVFYGLSSAVGGNAGLLADYAPHAVALLRGIRYALSHPHRFCALVVPADEDEVAALEKELESLTALAQKDDDVDLLDRKNFPVVASRAEVVVCSLRTALVTLVRFTRAWESLVGEQPPNPEYVIPYDDEHLLSTANDPVGVLNDMFLIASGYAQRLAPGSMRDVTTQAAEAAALLSTTQLLTRRALAPPDDKHDRTGQMRRELETDVSGMLSEDGGMVGVLRGVALSEFAE